MERLTTITFVAGFGFFAVAFVLSMIFPWMTLNAYHGMSYATIEELAREPIPEFRDLAERYPEAFRKAFGEPDGAAFADALREGRDIYAAEGCWHCHSQYVREVSNEPLRWGPPATAQEYFNELNLPHLWGTRRVGPDLSRENGVHSNDWHVAHLWDPQMVVPDSVMPRYPWFFEEDGLTPNRRGLAMVSYLQFLGSRERERPREP